jgi:hypothetical protein
VRAGAVKVGSRTTRASGGPKSVWTAFDPPAGAGRNAEGACGELNVGDAWLDTAAAPGTRDENGAAVAPAGAEAGGPKVCIPTVRAAGRMGAVENLEAGVGAN